LEGLGHIVTVSAGALALLVTFRGTLVGVGSKCVWVLGVSWIALALAVLFAVWWKLAASDAVGSMLNDGDADHGWLNRLSWLSFVGLAVGIVALAIFGVANL
jgi:hypothetical protein